MTNLKNELDPNKKSTSIDAFDTQLHKRIVGQEEAVEALVRTYQTFSAGLNIPGRPIANLLFLGPTGTGKTHIVETMSEIIFGDNRVIKIDCGEFQHSHEIAKIIGSPPGYLGHRETHPLLTQDKINGCFNEKDKFAIVLFDEIEKANDALWKLLLSIMDKASLTLGDCRNVNLENCIIVMTSNLGTGEMNRIIDGGFGFSPKNENVNQGELTNVAIESAKRKFTPEFMNRIDDIIVFKTLSKEEIYKILDIELGQLQRRILKSKNPNYFVFTCTQEVKDYIVKIGFDAKYNARNLKRAIEKLLLVPFARMVSSSQINLGDFVRAELNENGELRFIKAAENVLIPVQFEEKPRVNNCVPAAEPEQRSFIDTFKQAERLNGAFGGVSPKMVIDSKESAVRRNRLPLRRKHDKQ